MRLLFWTPNYAPEALGIPPLVTDAAEGLAARGHDVDVVAPFPNYPERRIRPPYQGRVWLTEEQNGVRVHRHWLRVRSPERFLDKALYELSCSTAALRFALPLARAADSVICVVPTLLASTYASLIPKRSNLVLWVQDIVLAAAESVGSSSRITRAVLSAARRIERVAAKRADRLVVCSPGFIEHYACLGVDPGIIDVVYNWADIAAFPKDPPRPTRDRPRFLYAGNLGYTQGFGTLAKAAELVDGLAEVSIVGAGNAEDEVRGLADTLPNVRVKPAVPREAIPALYGDADVHVVIQRRVSAGVNLPSKIATCLASGKPIVASIADDTPAAALLRESGGALVVEPEDPVALAGAMRELAEQPELRNELGGRGRAFAEAFLSKEAALERLEEVIQR